MHRSAPQHQAPARVSLLEPVLPGQRRVVSWTRPAGDSLPLALARAASHLEGPLAVITPDMQSAESLQEQLEFFLTGSAIGIKTFPDWETLPYDTFSPHQDIISERLATLNHLAEMRQGVLIIAVTTLLQRLPPRGFLYQHSLILRRGQQLDLDAMRTRLDNAGYRCVSQVMEHGEFAVRGSLLDLYPMGSPLPLRIDLFDAEIDSIRTFDPETQRSLTEQDAVNLLPAREFPLDEEGIRGFRQRFRASFEGNPQDCPIYREISQGITPGGIEYYLPLFFEETETLFDYLPGDTCLAFLDATEAAGEDFQRQLAERFESRRHDRERPILPPERLYLGMAELRDFQNRYPLIRVIASGAADPPDDCITYATRPLGDLKIRPRHEAPAGALQAFIAEFPGRILLTAESSGRRETLHDQLQGFAIRPVVVRSWADFIAATDPVCLTVAPLEQGMVMDVPAIAVITETSLFGERARQTAPAKTGTRPRRDHPGPHRSQSRGAGGARKPWRRTLPRTGDADRQRHPGRVPLHRIRRRGQALRPGRLPATGQPLYRRIARRGPAAQARRRPVAARPAEGREARA